MPLEGRVAVGQRRQCLGGAAATTGGALAAGVRIPGLFERDARRNPRPPYHVAAPPTTKSTAKIGIALLNTTVSLGWRGYSMISPGRH